jgi:hypothetical protein
LSGLLKDGGQKLGFPSESAPMVTSENGHFCPFHGPMGEVQKFGPPPIFRLFRGPHDGVKKLATPQKTEACGRGFWARCSALIKLASRNSARGEQGGLSLRPRKGGNAKTPHRSRSGSQQLRRAPAEAPRMTAAWGRRTYSPWNPHHGRQWPAQ